MAVAVLEDGLDILDVVDPIVMGQFDGNTSRFTAPCDFQIDQLLGKLALHGAKEFLVFLDRCVFTHGFRRRHGFAFVNILFYHG